MGGRVPGLDGLRGIAILTVVGYHAIDFPAGGLFGVDLFFVLSGYLITSLLVAEWQASGAISLRRFWSRRARRLLPALVVYFGTLAALAAVGLARSVVEPREVIATAVASTYTTNFFAMLGLLGNSATWIGGFWSLAAEEQFYLVWPVALTALLAGGMFRLRAVTLGLLGAALAGFVFVAMAGTIQELHYSPLARSAPIVAGCALAVLPAPRFRGGLLSGATLFGLACVLGGPSIEAMRWSAPLALVGAVLLVANARASRLLALSPLVFVGAISYSLYLWHPLFLHFVDWVWLAVLLAIAVSYASTRWVENPIRHGFPTAGLRAWRGKQDWRAPNRLGENQGVA